MTSLMVVLDTIVAAEGRLMGAPVTPGLRSISGPPRILQSRAPQ